MFGRMVGFFFSKISIAIFSELGMKALREFESDLDTLVSNRVQLAGKNQNYCSGKSISLIEKIKKLIRLFIENNNVAGLLNADNINDLVNLVIEIESNKNTYLPAIFNEESYQLSSLFFLHLQKFKAREYINNNLNSIPSFNIVNIDALFDRMCENLNLNIKLYNFFRRRVRLLENYSQLQTNIDEIYKNISDKIKNEKIEMKSFTAEYNNKMKDILLILETHSYTMLSGGREFLKDCDVLNGSLSGNKRNLLAFLIGLEDDINKVLKENKVDFHVDDAHSFLKSTYVEKKGKQLINKFKQIFVDFNMLPLANNGNNHSLRDSIRELSEQLALLVPDLEHIQGELYLLAFEALKLCMITFNKIVDASNNTLSKDILAFSIRFLEVVESCNEVNDRALFNKLQSSVQRSTLFSLVGHSSLFSPTPSYPSSSAAMPEKYLKNICQP